MKRTLAAAVAGALAVWAGLIAGTACGPIVRCRFPPGPPIETGTFRVTGASEELLIGATVEVARDRVVVRYDRGGAPQVIELAVSRRAGDP